MTVKSSGIAFSQASAAALKMASIFPPPKEGLDRRRTADEIAHDGNCMGGKSVQKEYQSRQNGKGSWSHKGRIRHLFQRAQGSPDV